MLDKYLVKSIIDMTLFLEFTDGALLDEDVAIARLEGLASELHCMDAETKKDFCLQIRELAKDYSEKSDFVMNLPRTLGLD
jgi:hypothetical protein